MKSWERERLFLQAEQTAKRRQKAERDQTIWELHQDGLTKQTIADRMGLSWRAVFNSIKRQEAALKDKQK